MPPESESCRCCPEISELLSFGMNSRDLLRQAEHIAKGKVCENSRLPAWEQFCDGNWTGMKAAGSMEGVASWLLGEKESHEKQKSLKNSPEKKN